MKKYMEFFGEILEVTLYCKLPVLNYSRSVYAAGLAAIKCIMEDNKPLHRLSIEILVAVQECQNFP